MHHPQNILIRLPNWLGDMVMSTAFVKAVSEYYPGASVDLIAKKNLDFLLDYFPAHHQRYIFSKETYKGLAGALKFGREIKHQKKYDLFFCLPDSFSSAMMGYATGAKKRIGFKNEVRTLLLTSNYPKKKGLHRVEEYIDLLQQFVNKEIISQPVTLQGKGNMKKTSSLVININSEAASRRLPVSKAVSIINTIRRKVSNEIILPGSPKEMAFVNEVYNALEDKKEITNIAGKTSVVELVELLGSAAAVLTTDSGPAHIANAMGTHSIVLFGAGNEKNTAPYNKNTRTIIRLGELGCEPCTKNICRLYDQPKCLTLLDEDFIAGKVQEILSKSTNQ